MLAIIISINASNYTFQKCWQLYFPEMLSNLISRNDTSAMIVDPQQSWEQLRSIFEDEVLTIAEGKEVALNAETFCVHGDTSEALILVKYLNAQIKKNYSI